MLTLKRAWPHPSKRFFPVLILLGQVVLLFGQAPAIQWQNTIGGSDNDDLYSVRQTSDGGYILGGASISNISGDKTENSQGLNDYWIVKLNASGNILWQNTTGGSGEDALVSVQQTRDGGYILGGSSRSSISGDKTEKSQGLEDYWVVKLNASGNLLWQNTIGGSAYDFLSSIQQTSDGGYILGGYSASNISGDKMEKSQGGYDYWVVKLDSIGNIVWQNTLGGSGDDQLESVQQISDGGYILGGWSVSNISGDKTENSQGDFDFWVVKINATGSIVWQNTIGGSSLDALRSVQQTSDGGYVLGGYSWSNISGDKTENRQGPEADYWVVKLNGSGNILWQNTIGGSTRELFYSIQQTSDGGYILAGYSDSNISGDKSENSQGSNDFWVVKINGSGNIIWQKTIGGSGGEFLTSIQQTSDGGFILGGLSNSNISGNKTENSQGLRDFWVVKLASDCTTLSFTSTNPSCSGSANGSVQVDPTAPVTGYTYLWSNGATTRAITNVGAGSYTVTVTKTAAGCSVVGSATLTEPPPIAVTALSATICNGATYPFNGQTLTAAGNYTAHLIAANGCDSTVTLALAVLPTKSTALSASICPGSTYPFNGQTLAAAGTYTANLIAANGCDSTVTLSLAILPTKSTALAAAICPGATYPFNGQILAAAGNYTASLIAANGCDSTVTLALVILPTKSTALSAAICPGASYPFNGQTLATAGTYTANLIAANGCDSTVTLALVILPTKSTALSASICPGATYPFNGQTLTAAGNYTANLTAANGCDSTVTLALAILPTKSTALSAAICPGATYPFNGQTLATAGNYTANLIAANGCDSTVTLALAILPTKSTALSAAICPGATYPFNGQTLAAAGSYTAHLIAANGCDSTVTLALAILPTKSTALSAAICPGASYPFNGQTLTAAGNYTANLIAANGCDSTVTLALAILPTKSTTLSAAICPGATYPFNGQTLTAAGNYTANLIAANGCDSTVTLALAILPTKSTALSAAICPGASYPFNGQTLTAAGNYTANLTAANGCDSTVTLVLAVLPTKSTALSASICPGATYPFNGQTLAAAGNYTANLVAANGCDSTVTLALAILPTKSTALSAAICPGASYPFNGQTLTAAGNYTAHLVAANGCDSTVMLALAILPTKSTALSAAICPGATYTFNGQTLTAAGNYTAHLVAANGCDSTVTLALTIEVVEIGVTLSGMTLTAQATNASWQWLDCNGFVPIAGATSAVFTPGKTGFYAVQVTQNGCVDTSGCKAVTIVSTVEPDAHVSWLLAPNPANDAVVLVFSKETPDPCEVQISNLSGKIYRQIHIPENTLQFPVDVKDLPPGIWLFGMTNGIARTVKRLVKVDAQ